MSRVTEDQLRDCVLLYVEDDDATAYLFQMALEEAGIQAEVLPGDQRRRSPRFRAPAAGRTWMLRHRTW